MFHTTTTKIYKRTINDESITLFHNMLTTANSELVTECTDVNSAYNTFLTIFSKRFYKVRGRGRYEIKISKNSMDDQGPSEIL